MKPLVTVGQAQAADEAAATAGIGIAVLMARAGAAVAGASREVLGGVAGRRVLALAGRGHNGGDALEALTRLAQQGAGTEALLTVAEADLDDGGRRRVLAVRAAGGRVRQFTPELGASLLAQADLVVDGVLGTGASGAPRGAAAAAIGCVAATAVPVVAVDIPSGVDADTGEIVGEAVRATVTVTFQAAKPGHVLPPGSERAGRLVVADIGLPLGEPAWGITEAADLRRLVPVPTGELHKRTRGTLLVVAGSPGMGGAPTLVGRAARAGGAGLLVLATPASVSERVGAAVPEALTIALPEDAGGIAPSAYDVLERWVGEAGAVAVGPGLGRADGTGELVRRLLGAARCPMVVDADGLYALGHGEPLRYRDAPTLVTPHGGEFARLAPGLKGTRLEQALDRSAAWGATVLLKGNWTVIAEPGGRLAVNPTGSPVLATGGTGDVLTGLVGVLLAQRLGAFDAARLGAFAHGRAGSLAAAARGPVSVAAGDVADHLPGALTELLAARPGA